MSVSANMKNASLVLGHVNVKSRVVTANVIIKNASPVLGLVNVNATQVDPGLVHAKKYAL